MKPIHNPGYLRWIRTLPCAVCRATRAVEAAHTGPHGLSQKSSDLCAIPLCARHHRTGDDSYHKLGPRKFAEEARRISTVVRTSQDENAAVAREAAISSRYARPLSRCSSVRCRHGTRLARSPQAREGVHNLGLFFDFRQRSEMALDVAPIQRPFLPYGNRQRATRGRVYAGTDGPCVQKILNYSH